jgi:hypothetical protein
MSAPLPLTSVFFSPCGPHPSHSGENVIVEAQHTPYVEPSSKHLNLGLNPSQSLTPVSIGVTDHHYLVLRPGQLQMLSSLSGKVGIGIYELNHTGLRLCEFLRNFNCNG